MYTKAKRAERWIAVALAPAVFVIGMAMSYEVYLDGVSDHARKVADEFAVAANQYAFLVQRQLDVYSATNRSLAAYASASKDVDNASLANFVHAAHYFERLGGMSAFGYLPRVAARDAAAFERRAGREFPGYRIRNRRAGADFLYPLLYGVHATNPSRIDALRGVDFSSVPQRLAAIRAAEESNWPAASRVHASLADPDRPPVLVTFTPVAPPQRSRGRASPGVVYSVIDVSRLFASIDNGRIGSSFDLEVHEEDGAQRHLVYDADAGRHAGAQRPAAPFAYSARLRYADQVWRLGVYARPAYVAARADTGSWMPLALGALLSLIAAWATVRVGRHYVSRHTSAELAERFESFFEAHPYAVYSLDRQRRIVFANEQMAQQIGWRREDLIGQPVERFGVAENQKMAEQQFREVLRGHAVAYHNVARTASGVIQDLAIVLIPIIAGGEVVRVLGFAENITERKRSERELFESRQMLRLILDTVPLRVFWKDVDSTYLGANRLLLEEAGLGSVEQIVGRTDHDLAWRDLADQFREEDRQVMRNGAACFTTQQPRQMPDGSLGWFEVSKVPLTDHGGAVVGVLGVARDITENKRLEEELLRRANYDSLTGLPNRAFFYSELQQAIKRAHRRQAVLALLYFDIDRFKQVNDSFGHDAGDEVIRTFAARVRTALREADFVARLGGDEFVLVVEDLAARGDAATVAEKLIAAMQAPFRLGERTHPVSTSIGIAYLETGMSADQLIKAADDAMYEAKRAGRNCFRQVSSASAG